MAKRAVSKRAVRQRLLDEKARLERELAEIEERAAKTGGQEAASELSGYEDHPAHGVGAEVEGTDIETDMDYRAY